MRAVTIREAKAKLNALVEAALRGEQVVLLRGSRHVAAIVPVSAEELELAPRLSDAQATRLWQMLAAEREAGSLDSFASPQRAIEHLSRAAPRGGNRGRPARARTRRSKP